MFVLKFKTTLIAAAIASLFLFSFVDIGNTLEIEEMSPDHWSSTETWDWGYGAYHGVYLRTDRPYYTVHWSVNGVRVEVTPGGYEGDENGPTEASFSTYLTGSVTGTVYEIKLRLGIKRITGTYSQTLFLFCNCLQILNR